MKLEDKKEKMWIRDEITSRNNENWKCLYVDNGALKINEKKDCKEEDEEWNEFFFFPQPFQLKLFLALYDGPQVINISNTFLWSGLIPQLMWLS